MTLQCFSFHITMLSNLSPFSSYVCVSSNDACNVFYLASGDAFLLYLSLSYILPSFLPPVAAELLSRSLQGQTESTADISLSLKS